jgi:hypothetical protein
MVLVIGNIMVMIAGHCMCVCIVAYGSTALFAVKYGLVTYAMESPSEA